MKRHQNDQSRSTFLASLILLLLLLQVHTTTTALILPPLSNLNQTASTQLQPPTNISTTTAPTGPIRHCVADPTWSKSHHDIAPSCETALQALIDDERIYGSRPGVFVFTTNNNNNNNARSWAHFPATGHSLTLPKRYISKQCVVAVVMVKMFENAAMHFPELPGGERWPFVDEVRWGELVEPASYVRATCGNGVGYAVVGREGGVAVLILEVESWWDRFILGLVGGEGGDVAGG